MKSWNWPRPPTRRWNMILVPSGDQVGVKSPIVLLVSRACPVPSAFITQTSKVMTPPSRSGSPILPDERHLVTRQPFGGRVGLGRQLHREGEEGEDVRH